MDESERRGPGEERVVEQTPELWLTELAAPTRAQRWQAALALAHAIDIGSARGGQYRSACVPVLIEILEQHEDDTACDAEAAARRLVDIGERTADVHAGMVHCLERAEQRLAGLEAAAERPHYDAYCSLVTGLRSYLDDFRASPVASFAPPSIAAAAASRRPGKPGGGGAVLFVLLVGAVLAFGGAAALLWSRKLPRAVSLNAALTAIPSAPAARPTNEPAPPKH